MTIHQESLSGFRVSKLARFLGRTDCSEVRFEEGRLRLVGRRSGSTVFLTTDLVPRVTLHRGLIWSSVLLSDRRGHSLRIGGLSREVASALETALDRWLESSRQAFHADLVRTLAEADAIVRPLLQATRYVRHSEAARARVDATPLITDIRDLLSVSDASGELGARGVRLLEILERVGNEIDAANERFVASELDRRSTLFDTVESRPLTIAQRRACIVNDECNLVLAGAGTGKTSVMIGRVAYLLAAGLAEPETILMVAYNREAARELRERAARRLGSAIADRLTIKTFHALGVELIADVEGVQPTVAATAGDPLALAKFIDEAIEEALRDPVYADKFVRYGFDHLQPFRSMFECASLEEYERELAKLELRTLRGELVKSYEEVRIANFLARNGISYSYEMAFPIDTANRQYRQYRPDFTLHPTPAGAVPVYLEHFGVDDRGNPPPFFDRESAKRYVEQMAWKRELFRQYQKPLIETYSFEFRRGDVFDRLSEKLKSHGIDLKPVPPDECLSILRRSGVISGTAAFFNSLVPPVRDRALSSQEISDRIAAMPSHEERRASVLWDLLQPILRKYEDQLARAREVDFSEMVRRSTEYVKTGRFRSPFRHVLVDEFQDISEPRAELILSLTRSRPDATFFCVGDDWQSIYRFAGSDIRYTSDFERLVGRGSTTLLDRTFRFNDQIGRVASDFVMRNPAQVRKEIASETTAVEPAVSLVRTAEPVRGVEQVLSRIDADAARLQVRRSVYVLARYWHEVSPIEAAIKPGLRGRFPNLESVRYSTVHAAKGQEADFVLVVGLEEGRHGFPTDRPTDAFHEMFLPPTEDYAYAEERRLFYVALTRARHRVYLLYDTVGHSHFVRELRSGGYRIEDREFSGDFIQADQPVVPCPRCHTGEIRRKEGANGIFFACHRYPACRYTERGCGACGGALLRMSDYCVCCDPSCEGVHPTCPNCGSPMQHRTGPHGPFFGCSKYGSRDVLEQCSATMPWRLLPAATELRRSTLMPPAP